MVSFLLAAFANGEILNPRFDNIIFQYLALNSFAATIIFPALIAVHLKLFVRHVEKGSLDVYRYYQHFPKEDRNSDNKVFRDYQYSLVAVAFALWLLCVLFPPAAFEGLMLFWGANPAAGGLLWFLFAIALTAVGQIGTSFMMYVRLYLAYAAFKKY